MPSKKTGKSQGGTPAKLKKFPRIADYLMKRHKDVYDLIDDAAMHGSLSPRKGSGITFLLPEPALVKKITNLLESEDPERATDIISSLIITDYLPSVKEFAARKDDIPTLLGKKLVIKSVGANGVEIDNGTLTLDEGFKPFSRSGNATRGNMAVWKLKGEVEYEKAPRSEGKYTKSSGHSKKGGDGEYEGGGVFGGATDTEIESFIQKVVNDECASIAGQKPGEKRKSPMLRAVVNLLNEWKKSSPDKYDQARSILSLNPIISFFLIFKNRKFFPSADLDVPDLMYPADRDIVANFREIVGDKSGSAAMFSKRDAVKKAIEKIKSENPVNIKTPEKIKSIYTGIDENNSIGGIANVYPARAAEAFKSNPGLHLLIDEFRNFLYASVCKINCEKSPAGQAKAFSQLIHDVNAFRSLLHPERTLMDRSDPSDKSKSVMQVQGPFWKNFALHLPCVAFDEKR
jgi:hypothetical protein